MTAIEMPSVSLTLLPLADGYCKLLDEPTEVAAWTGSPPARNILGNALRRVVGGSSGPFYATALLRAAAILQKKSKPSIDHWLHAYDAGGNGIWAVPLTSAIVQSARRMAARGLSQSG